MCVEGARWVQQELLASQPSLDLHIYAIWFAMFPTDSRAGWPADLLTDRRVLQFWDEPRVVGGWYGRHPDYGTFQEDGILWDAYLLYGPEARWGEKPSHLVGWGYTIAGKRDELRRDLLSLPRRSQDPEPEPDRTGARDRKESEPARRRAAG